MRRIIPTVLLALVVYGNEAFAESKSHPAGSASTSCTIEAGTRGFHEGSVIIYGEMRVKILTEYGLSGGIIGPNYYSIFDIKAPRYLKRGIRLKSEESFTDTICGSEVTIVITNSGMGVTVF